MRVGLDQHVYDAVSTVTYEGIMTSRHLVSVIDGRQIAAPSECLNVAVARDTRALVRIS